MGLRFSSEDTGDAGTLVGSAVPAADTGTALSSDTFGGKTSLGLENVFLLLQRVVTHKEHPARGRGAMKCHMSPLQGHTPTLVLEPMAGPVSHKR